MLAAIVGFGNFSVVAAGIGKVLFFLSVFLLIAALVMALVVRRGTVGFRRW
jgi:uncharacterized membrane protein YtjA (UPF0391 family)